MKILMFGGSGKLGQSIKKINKNIVCPSHNDCEIVDYFHVLKTINFENPDVIIHAAAIVGINECENNKELAWKVNVEGTNNIVKVCRDRNIKLIFISSAAIFDGKKGEYSEEDYPTPVYYYSITKVAAEQAVRQLQKHIIVRLDFYPKDKFKYNSVFSDHFTSKVSVEEAAEGIIKILNNKDFVGIINIGQKRNTLFNILKDYYKDIKPIKISQSTMPDFPKDLSLDLNKWDSVFGNNRL